MALNTENLPEDNTFIEGDFNGAQYLVQALQQYGVDCVFGYPGGAIMPVYDALYGAPIKHILCRHEQGCGFAAMGYAKSTGRTGVCLATSGPGATNLITALADAMLDSVPLIAITGQVSSELIGSDAFQEVDVIGLSLAVTKHSFLVTDVEELPSVLEQAFQLANSGRKGPVLVDITKDVQLAKIASESLRNKLQQSLKQTYRGKHESNLQRFNLLPTMADFQRANIMLQMAKKPVVYVGGGVASANAMDELAAFLQSMQIPVVTTLKGIGCVKPDYPYFLGMLGMHGWPAANQAVQQSDCLLVFGARFDDRVTGKLDTFAPSAKVIHLDIDEAEINKLRAADVSIIGDIKRSISFIGVPNDISDWQQECLCLKQQQESNSDKGASTDQINPIEFLRSLQLKIDENAVISCDVGQHQMWVAQHMNFGHPNNYLSSGGLGTMGFGLPAAIGAQIARADAQIIAISGDGSFMMNVQELATINRYQLPVKIVILDNQRLGMVRQWQQLFFAERFSETNLSDNPDFVAIAAACGISGKRIERKDELQHGINQLIQAESAFLLHVCIPAMENVWPLVPPGKANHQMITHAALSAQKSSSHGSLKISEDANFQQDKNSGEPLCNLVSN